MEANSGDTEDSIDCDKYPVCEDIEFPMYPSWQRSFPIYYGAFGGQLRVVFLMQQKRFLFLGHG